MFSLFGCGKSIPSSTKYNVSGRIIDGNGNGIQGVTITFNPGSSITQTDADGKWSMAGISGNATVTPAKQEWTFNPSNRTVSQAATNINFTGTRNQYALTVQVSGNGNVTKTPAQASYAYATSVMLTAIADEGWAFSHWEGDATGNTNPTTVIIDQAKNVKAVFTQLQYDLNITVTGEGQIYTEILSTLKSASYPYGTTLRLTAQPSTGWRFDHWEGDLSGSSSPATLTVVRATSITAIFVPIEYLLTTSVLGQGSITKSPSSDTYKYSDSVFLTAKPSPGWSFDHWEGDVEGTENPTALIINADKSCKAIFTQDQYSLTMNTVGQGSVTKNPDQVTYIYGSSVTLTAIADEGWAFNHWEGDITGNTTPTTVIIDTAMNITAVFTISPYTLVQKWGSFNEPRGVAIGLDTLYIADTYNYKIQQFDQSGNYIRAWGSPGLGNGQFISIGGIAVDVLGNVYVADSGGDSGLGYPKRVHKYTSSGGFITSWGSEGSSNGQFYDGPKNVAVALDGNVYVTDAGNHRVQKFDSNGNFIKAWGEEGSGDGQFMYPYCITTDSLGFIYVADIYGRVQKFSNDGSFILDFTAGNDIRGIAVDTNGYIYVTDLCSKVIKKFNADGNLITEWGQNIISDKNGRTGGLAIDSQGNVYVTNNNKILKFAPNE